MKISRSKVLCYLALTLLLAGALLFLFRRPVLIGLAQYFVVADPLEKAEAIAVLSGHSGIRAAKAGELYLQGWAPRILLTKGTVPYRELELRRYAVVIPEEHEMSAGVLRNLGVPEGSIVTLDGNNGSTYDEAQSYLRFMQHHGWRSLIVVTCNYHTRRSRLLFRRLFRGSGITVSMQPGPPEWEFDPDGWWTRRADAKTLLWECQKLIYYTIRY